MTNRNLVNTNNLNITRYLGIIFVVILLGLGNISASRAESLDVFFPNYERQEYTFPVNDDNDIFLKADQFHQLVTHNLAFNSSSMSQRSYNGFTRSGATTRSAGETFTVGNNGIYEFLNSSNAGQELRYTRNYFGLVDNETTNIANVFVESGNDYLVSFTIDNLDPVSFAFLFSQIASATTLTLTLSIVDPMGNFDSRSVGIVKDIMQIVPFVPLFTGEYFMSIETSRDGIMKEMQFLVNPNINSLGTGIAEHFEEDNTFIRFYKSDGSGQAQVIDFNALVFQNEYYASDFSPNEVLGDIEIIIFDPSAPFFGVESSSALVTSSSDFYVVIVAHPADQNDPLVRKIRSEQGVDYGMDIDLTLTLRKYQVTSLPTGEDFVAESLDPYSFSSGIRFYTFTTENTVLVGVNASVNDDITFSSSDPEIGTITINNANNDILNSIVDDAAVLPAGTYIVELTSDETYHFKLFTPTSLNVDTPTIITPTIGDQIMFYLASSEVTRDRIDIYYMDENNETVTYEIAFYAMDGTKLNDVTDTLQWYYNDVDNLIFNNETSEAPSHIRNLEGLYFKLEITDNEKFVNGTLAYSGQTNITSSIELTRINEYDELQANDGLGAYYYDVLNQALSYDLNSANATIQFIMDFHTEENKVYKITIDSTNRTIADFDLYVRDTSTWFNNVVMTTITNISGIDHYILNIYFASTMEMHMGMYLTMGTQVANGTLDINVFDVALTEFPELNVPNLSEGSISLSDDKDDNIFANPLLYVGIAGGLVLIGALVYFLRARAGKVPR